MLIQCFVFSSFFFLPLFAGTIAHASTVLLEQSIKLTSVRVPLGFSPRKAKRVALLRSSTRLLKRTVIACGVDAR